MKKHIPNLLTVLNLLSGCIAITFAFHDNLIAASWLIGLGAVFDFLDGMAARLLKVKSAIGKELDSLADMVSFGVVPGVIVFQLLNMNPDIHLYYISYIAFLIPVFSSIRLAKFNTDARQEEMFYGLPTPANAILIASLPLILNHQVEIFNLDLNFMKPIISNSYFLVSLTVLSSWLLVAEIPLMSLKFKSVGWAENKPRYILMLLSVLLLIFIQFAGIPLIIFSYIIISLSLGRRK
jgi:CDP-diacylglycerol--serine O-phosphatidyltransferase